MRILRSFLDVFWRNEINLRAAGISYYIFFALIPMLTAFVSLVITLPFWKIEVEKALLFLTRWLVPDAIHEVHDYVRALAEHAGVASFIGLVVAAWVLFKVVFFIEGILDRIWCSETRRYPGCTLKKAFFGWLFLSVAVTVGAVLSAEGTRRIPVELLGAWLFFMGFNKLGPNRPIRWRQALPGSMVGAIAWYSTKWAFTAYLTRIHQPDQVYAVLGVFPLFLVWMYCTIAILLSSACLNFVLSERPDLRAIKPELQRPV